MKALLLSLLISIPAALAAQTAPDSTKPSIPQSDSLTTTTDKQIGKVDTLQLSLTRYQRKLDLLQRKLSHRIDSLRSLHLPADTYTKTLDSLQHLGAVKDLRQADANIQKLETKLNQSAGHAQLSVQQAEQKINSALQQFDKDTGLKIPTLQSPALNTSVLSLPGLQTPGAGLPTTTNGEIGKAPGAPGISNANQSSIGKDISGVNSEMAKAQGELKQAGTYANDVKAISTGHIDSAQIAHASQQLESRVANMGELRQLKTEQASIDQLKAQSNVLANPLQNKEVLQKEAINHFAGKEQVLQQSMEQLTKLKQKYSEVSSVADVLKHPPNPMHGRPLLERLTPGINLQFQAKDHLLVDFNPYIGYKLTRRLTTGIGWNERLNFHGSHHNGVHVKAGSVYGPRAFADFSIGRGFSLHGEIESMNAYVPTLTSTGTSDPGHRQWLWNGFVGLKKDYRLVGDVRGTVQTLYSLSPIDVNASPYADRFQVRMGFELPLKKKMIPPHILSPAGLQSKLKVMANEHVAGYKALAPYGSVNKYKATAKRYRRYFRPVTSLYRFGNDTLIVTRSALKKKKGKRDVVFHDTHFVIKLRSKGRAKIYEDDKGLVATSKKWYDLETVSRTFIFVSMSDQSAKFTSDGADVVKAALIADGPGFNVQFTWFERLPEKELLEIMTRVSWSRSIY